MATVTTKQGSPAAPPLIEREQVWAQLERSAASLVLTGEAGIGKTRLALESTVNGLIVQGHEDTRATPLAPFAQTIRNAITARPEILESLEQVWWLEVARLIPELEPDAPPEPLLPEGRSRFLEGLTRAMVLIAEAQDVMIDDPHLFDASSCLVFCCAGNLH